MASYTSGTSGIGPFANADAYKKAITPTGSLDGRDYNYAGEYLNGGGGDVLGASTSGGGGGGVPAAPVDDGGGGGADPNAALWAEIDNVYNTILGVAGERESTLRGNQTGINQEIEAQYGASKATGQATQAAGAREITQEETGAGQTKDSALKAGKRLYSELEQGNRQRFGGKSLAGGFVSALQGREYQRGQADVFTKYQTAMSKITDLKSNLSERWDAFEQNLEVQKQSAFGEARRQFQERLSEIDSLKAEAAVNKSQMRLDVLGNLRNQIFQINLANAQTSQAAQQQLQQNEAQLAQYEQQVQGSVAQGQQAGQQLAGTTTTSPTSNLAISGGGLQQQAPTQGRITPRREDDPYGLA